MQALTPFAYRAAHRQDGNFVTFASRYAYCHAAAVELLGRFVKYHINAKMYNVGMKVIQVDDVLKWTNCLPQKARTLFWLCQLEFIVGFVVVYIVMMVLSVTIGLLNQHFGFFH